MKAYRNVYLFVFIFSIVFPALFFCYDSNAGSIYFKEEGGVKHYTNVKPGEAGFSRLKSGWPENSYTDPGNSHQPSGSGTYSDKYDEYIKYASGVYDIDPDLVKAVIKVESDFYHRAVSPKGAMGVMQLMPGTADYIGVKRPFDPSDNIMGGSKYLRKLLDMFNGNKTLALAGYNAGENAVIRYGYSVPPYRETQNYVRKVIKHYNRIKNSRHSLNTTVAEKTPSGKLNEKKVDEAKTVSKVTYRESLSPDGNQFRRKTEKKSRVIVESVKYMDAGENPNPGRKISENYTSTDSKKGDYTVQIASFSEIDSAKQLESSLKSKTVPAYIKVARIPGKGTWYRVRAGGFNSKSEAASYAEYLKSQQPYIDGAYVTAAN